MEAAVENKTTDPSEVRMTFGEHIEELRKCLWKSLLMLVGTFAVAMVYYEKLVEFVSRPHMRAMALLGKTAEESKFITQSYTHPIVAELKLAFIVGVFVASPFIAYQFWKFISAGLYFRERKYVLTFAPASFGLFAGGCCFGYFVMIPYALYGLAKSNPANVAPVYAISEYLQLVMTLTIIMGAIFELPLLMLFFAKIGLVTPQMYNKWRRFAVVMNFILAAVLTPPDVISMILMAVPLLLLYEIGVILSYIAVRKPKVDKPAAA